MKKLMALVLLGLIFIACGDYSEGVGDLRPDIEVVFMNPVGWYTCPSDSDDLATIEEIKFVARNSVDSYLRGVTWEYIDSEGTTFYVGDPFALFAKIEGLVTPEVVDTTTIENLSLPLAPARNHLIANNLEAANVHLHFVAESEYDPEKKDTASVWFGIYLVPQVQ